ncbi:MAG: hypothetical protein MJZ77_08550 [Bacteroidales bacterium]|nr:hypothetical protein [Bacteroidales bacterium]
MKKFVLTLAFAVLAIAANAQLVISANVGGTKTSGNIHTKQVISIVADSTSEIDAPMDINSSFTGGLKVGYKLGRCQFGIAGSYSTFTNVTAVLDPNLVPIPAPAYGINVTGTVTTKSSSYAVSPYFRYDILQTGDVAIFAELSGSYIKQNDPMVNAELSYEFTRVALPKMDTVISSPHPLNSTTIAVRVTPGLSWQLSDHCGVDLYLDFLSLAYSKTNTQRIDPVYTVTFNGTGIDVITAQTERTTEESGFGGALTGTPLLTEVGQNNWVRVGFNFTF